jgi:hypothetical protein
MRIEGKYGDNAYQRDMNYSSVWHRLEIGEKIAVLNEEALSGPVIQVEQRLDMRGQHTCPVHSDQRKLVQWA